MIKRLCAGHEHTLSQSKSQDQDCRNARSRSHGWQSCEPQFQRKTIGPAGMGICAMSHSTSSEYEVSQDSHQLRDRNLIRAAVYLLAQLSQAFLAWTRHFLQHDVSLWKGFAISGQSVFDRRFLAAWRGRVVGVLVWRQVRPLISFRTRSAKMHRVPCPGLFPVKYLELHASHSDTLARIHVDALEYKYRQRQLFLYPPAKAGTLALWWNAGSRTLLENATLGSSAVRSCFIAWA